MFLFVQFLLPSDKDICISRLILLGNDHMVMVTLEGNLYSSGSAEQGQLGRVPEHFSNRGGRKGLGKSLCF